MQVLDPKGRSKGRSEDSAANRGSDVPAGLPGRPDPRPESILNAKYNLSQQALKYFVSLAPRLLVDDLLHGESKYREFDDLAAMLNLPNASKALTPTMTSFEGAVMVADVKGFTRLTEVLGVMKAGSDGIELLTTCMNNYFSRAIKVINFCYALEM